MGEIVNMIDLHAHILHGLDDGPETLTESLEMIRVGYQDGIRVIVATPHTHNGIYQNDRATILAKVQELNNALKEFGIQNSGASVRNSKSEIRHAPRRAHGSPEPHMVQGAICNLQSAIPMKVLPGADVHFLADMLPRYERGEIETVNDQGRFVMVEFPSQGIPYRAEEVLYQFIVRGIIPIISHPERNLEIGHKAKRYYEMIRMGCLGQVTAMSLTGEFGNGVRRVAEKLLSKRLLHIIASDAHSTNGRPPILSSAAKAAEKIVGKEEAWRMVTEYPQTILNGQRPEVPVLGEWK
jgi:protein-tyrosine phosphatase